MGSSSKAIELTSKFVNVLQVSVSSRETKGVNVLQASMPSQETKGGKWDFQVSGVVAP